VSADSSLNIAMAVMASVVCLSMATCTGIKSWENVKEKEFQFGFHGYSPPQIGQMISGIGLPIFPHSRHGKDSSSGLRVKR